MVQEGRLRGIEIGLEALDAVEVGPRSNPLDIGQPLITDFGEGRTEVELPKRDVGGLHRLRSQDQLGRRQNPGAGNAAHRALSFDLELAEGLELITQELRPKRAPPAGWEAVQDAAAETELTARLHQGLAPVAEGGQTAQQVIECVGLARLEREAPLLQGLYAQRRPGDRGPGGEGD